MNFLFNKKFFSVFEISIAIVFGLTILSIPLFSFLKTYYVITWFLTILLVVLCSLYLLLYGKFKIDIIIISFGLFIISSIFGSALTGFKSFSFTPILNVGIIIFLYAYFSSCGDKQRMRCFAAIDIALSLFAIIFCLKYRSEILSLDFRRLGSAFGDENDISIILSLGYCFAFYYSLFGKRVFLRILQFLFALCFAGLSFTCGSKIAILIIFVCSIFCVYSFFGLKHWYISTIIIVFLIGGLVFALTLPPFATLKERFLSMWYSLIGRTDKNYNRFDLSTSGRIDMFANGISLFLRRPFFGYGLNGFHTFSSYQTGWSHNHWSDSFANYGLIGTGLYLMPFIIFLRTSPKNTNLISRVLLLCFLVSSISIALFTEKIFAYFVGLILSTSKCNVLYTFKRKGINKCLKLNC